MKTNVAGYIGSVVLGAVMATSMVRAAPVQVGTTGLKAAAGVTANLSIQGIHLHMSRAEVQQLHLDPDTYPLDLKYDATAHVSFVAGMLDRRNEFDYSNPGLECHLGVYCLDFYRVGSTLVITRFKPAGLAARSGGYTDFALASGVSWIPHDWGHDRGAQAIRQ